MDWNDQEQLTGIAIIGMAGRFPGARNVAELWETIKNKREGISFFTEEELLEAGISQELIRDPLYVKAGGVLHQIETFDAAFFDMTAREAEITDPQHRLFLECSWEALEQAGYDAQSYAGRIGVFGGVGSNRYGERLHQRPELAETVGELQAFLGLGHDFLSTRVSYKLDLKGPSLTVQTACSTSLVAVHLACQNLLLQECDIALAGGVSIRLLQKEGYLYQEGSILSPDGRCRAFDDEAKGTVGGDGAGIVVLKRLEDALADGDFIYAVIRGSAVNNDGLEKIGYTAPSVDGQAQVIRDALAVAGTEPSSIRYIESHGTGTPLGDPIEFQALQDVFGHDPDRTEPCTIGSVKTNIGHLDTAAGVTSLIKASLALQHQYLPPSLHFAAPNRRMDWANSPFAVEVEGKDWPASGQPRRAGVSSFGIGGTNAHVILEEAPQREASSAGNAPHLLVLSAKTEQALDQATQRLHDHLLAQPDSDLADVAYTLQVGRRAFRHRRLIACSNREEALQKLTSAQEATVRTAEAETRQRPIAFVFPGQGSQHVNMAFDLYRDEPVFRETVDQCAQWLQPELGLDIRSLLYPRASERDVAEQQLNQTHLTQPALFVIEYALAKLWMSRGVMPSAMIGHSIGEYVAACLADVMSLPDALRLVAVRGRLMQAQPEGAMLAVSLPEREVVELLTAGLELASVNGPNACIVGGAFDEIERFAARLEGIGVSSRRLQTSHAFHTGMMEPMLPAFADLLSHIPLRAPQIPVLSNVTGSWLRGEEATDPAYWCSHLRQTVRFADGVDVLLHELEPIWLEVGPGQAYGSLIKQQAASAGKQDEVVLSSLPRRDHDTSQTAFLLETFGELWLNGMPVDWTLLHQGAMRQRLPLPTYPFERKRYWLDPVTIEEPMTSSVAKKRELSDWFYLPTWKMTRPPHLLPPAEPASRWLVFADEKGTCLPWTERLQAAGHDIAVVSTGGQFAQLDEQHFQINPDDRGDYRQLFQALKDQERLPQRIAHFWSLWPSEQGSYQQTQGLGFYSLLYIAQAIGEHAPDDSISIGVVTNRLQEVTGEPIAGPERATLLGACRVIPMEYPNLSCRSIDIELPMGEELTAEFNGWSEDGIVAYRGGKRFVQEFEPIALHDRTDGSGTGLHLQKHGVYLITGAAGESGRSLAEQLALALPVKLVLVGRDVNQELTDHLTRLGTEVLWADADVQDLEEMREVMRQTRERFGQLHGVFHAEDREGSGLVQLKTEEAAERVLGPLVKGMLVLEKALDGEEPAFIALYSSTASLLGGFGQVSRCAAHAFFDAYAQAKRAEGMPVLSINWGLWQWDDRLEQQVAGIPHLLEAYQTWRRDLGLSPAEGLEALQRILHSGLTQTVVSTQDFASVRAEEGTLTAARFWEAVADARQVENELSDESDDREEEPLNEMERKVANIWQDLFGLSRVRADQDFFKLGGNSLMVIQLITRLRQTVGADVPIQTVFEHPTVEGLAREVSLLLMDPEELAELERMLQAIESLGMEMD